MTDKPKNRWEEYLESDEYQDLVKKFQEAADHYESECDTWWEDLPYDEKLKAFYSVVKRIVQAELKDHGTYRWALYDVFGFGPEAYTIGMECGFMDLHNSIYTLEEARAIRDKAYQEAGYVKVEETKMEIKDKE